MANKHNQAIVDSYINVLRLTYSSDFLNMPIPVRERATMLVKQVADYLGACIDQTSDNTLIQEALKRIDEETEKMNAVMDARDAEIEKERSQN